MQMRLLIRNLPLKFLLDCLFVKGRGYIHAVRKEDYVVKLFGWKLAQGQSPTCHLAPEAIKPLFVVGQEVKTIYGRGYIESVRLDKGDYVVKLFGWKLAQKQSPTLYLAHDSIQALFSVYEPVSTVYGKGFVQSVRAKDFVVKLDGWKLADGKSPTLYLAGDSMQVAKGC